MFPLKTQRPALETQRQDKALSFLLLIFGCLGLLCWVWAFSSCGDWGLLSSCGMMASLVAEHGPWSARVSVVVAHRLSCPTAHGIFLDQGPNLCPLYWQADSQPLDHQSSVIFGPGTTENHVTEGPDTREDYITPDPVSMENYTTPDLGTTEYYTTPDLGTREDLITQDPGTTEDYTTPDPGITNLGPRHCRQTKHTLAAHESLQAGVMMLTLESHHHMQKRWVPKRCGWATNGLLYRGAISSLLGLWLIAHWIIYSFPP